MKVNLQFSKEILMSNDIRQFTNAILPIMIRKFLTFLQCFGTCVSKKTNYDWILRLKQNMKIRVSWLVNVLAIMATLPMANAEKYKDASIPGLELCKEFKAYLERHPEKALFCELIPDPLFKNFRLPDLKPAPRGLGERVFFRLVR